MHRLGMFQSKQIIISDVNGILRPRLLSSDTLALKTSLRAPSTYGAFKVKVSSLWAAYS